MKSIDANITNTMNNMANQFSIVSTTVSSLNGELNGFDQTQKIITSSIGVGSASLGALSTAINIANDKQMIFNLEVLKNPYVLAAAAIVGLVAMLGILATSMDSINAEITARNDLRDKQQSQLEANLAEINNVDSLNTELLSLMDSEGKVSVGNQDRVAFIVSVF